MRFMYVFEIIKLPHQEVLLMTGVEGEAGEGPSLPLPMDQVFYKFSTNERRMMYDYAVEVRVMLN